MDKQAKLILIWGSAILVMGLFIYIVVSNTVKSGIDNDKIGVITENDHTIGNPNAVVSIVEYSDLQCPACAYIHKELIKPLLADYEDKVYYTFRHFPLKNIHPKAVSAARTVEAAGAQGKFWEMQDLLFENQQEWVEASDSKEKFNEYAGDLGLDIQKFKTDQSSARYLKLIEQSYDTAVASGLNYTPSIILNGELIDNPKSIDEFKAIIDEVIAEET